MPQILSDRMLSRFENSRKTPSVNQKEEKKKKGKTLRCKNKMIARRSLPACPLNHRARVT